jgi:hypothetical protein
MDLTKVLSISGKPGLFKVLGQTQNNGIIVESLMDGKRFPAYAAHKISSLEDISIYTEEEDVRLKEVFEKMYAKHEGEKSIDQNGDASTLRNYFKEVLPGFDEERVYNSDIKKVIRWYNDLHAAGMMKELMEAKEEKETKTEEKPKAKKATAKKETAKGKPAAQKATKQAPKATPKRTSSKKG